MVVAQRLARQICRDCRAEVEKNEVALLDLGMKQDDIPRARVFKGRGCKTCNNSGYKGRVALYEVMPFIDPLKELVLQGASAAELKAEMIRHNIPSLRLAGINKIVEGVTTPEEVLRVTVGD
jgi:type IV pilus assembly protein PilB